MGISIQSCHDLLKALPPTEMKYHLALLLKAVEMDRQKAQKSRYQRADLTDKNDELVRHLHDFLSALTPLMKDLDQPTQKFVHAYHQLVKDAKKNHILTNLSYRILMIGSAGTALLTGAIGGVIGGFSGFFRGIYNFKNPLPYSSAGFVTGLMLGAAIGFRTPKEFKNALVRRLQNGLNGLQEVLDANKDLGLKAFQDTQQEVKQAYFLGEDGKVDEFSFQNFLKRKDVPFELRTVRARFIGTTLEGYVGAHAFITIADPQLKKGAPLYLEYAPTATDPARPLLAVEKRTTSGQTIIDMMTIHKMLPSFSMAYFFKKGKVGQVDCFTHVNKILAATNQELCKLNRFEGNKISRKLIGFFLEKLSPFPQDLRLKSPLI